MKLPPEWTSGNVHQRIVLEIAERVPRGSSVLDLGAGAGSLSARLVQAGFVVCAADFMAQSFSVPEVPFVKVDLDQAEVLVAKLGAGSQRVVVSCEVVEHIRCPWRLVETCYQLLTPGGLLFLTTPNIVRPSSRVNVLVNGWPDSFGAGRRNMGHISPLFPSQLRDILEHAGFEEEFTTSIGDARVLSLRERSIRGVVQAAMSLALLPLMMRVAYGACLLIVARRPERGETESAREVRPPGTGLGSAYIIDAPERR